MLRTRALQGLLIAVVVLLTGLAALGASAGASTSSATDPTHDNGPDFDARGDVTAFSISNGTSIDVSATTRTFDNPATSQNWITEGSGILYGIDTNNDGDPEFIVGYFNDGSGNVIAGVEANDAVGTFLCDATPAFSASAKTYTASFPASCIGSPASVELSILLGYFTATTVSFDDTAFTTPATGPTTTTTTTVPVTTTTTTVPVTTTTTVPVTTTTTTVPVTTTTTVPVTTTTTTVPVTTTTTVPVTTTSTVPVTTTTTVPVTTTTTVPITTTTVPVTTTSTVPVTTTTTVPGTTTSTIGSLGSTSSSSPTTLVATATTTPGTSTTVAGTAGGNLPRTGSSALPLTLLAVTLIGAGSGLSVRRRRSREHH